MRRATLTVGLLVVLLAAAAEATAGTENEGSDLEARTLFAAGEYKQALDIYARLYAETLHPTYLRNIGRCQQNLGEPDKAIGSFREYLRKAKNLSPEQRAEIQGYITEMEQLKSSRAAPPPPASLELSREAGPAPSLAPYLGYGAAALAVVSFSSAAVTGSLATAAPVGNTRAEMQMDLERHKDYATAANTLLVLGSALAVAAATALIWHWRRSD